MLIPLIGCDEYGILSLWSSSPNQQPESNHEKNRRQIPVEGHSTKNCQCCPKKGSLRNCHNPETKETLQLNAMWYPRWNPGVKKKLKKRTLGKN